MSSLTDLTGRAPAAPTDGTAPRSPVPAGLAAAGQAAGTSMVGVLVPVVAAWALAASTRADWLQALRIALDVWLLGHHTGIAIPGGHIGLAPLALTAGALAVCAFAGRRLSRSLDPKGQAIRAGLSRAAPAAPPVRALIAFAGGYATLAVVVSLLAAGPDARPVSAQAFLGAAVVSGLGVLVGAAAYRAGGRFRDGVRFLLRRLPADAERCLYVGGLALAAQLVVATLVLVAGVVLGFDRVREVNGTLSPGLAGGTVLALAQLAYLPNAVLWAAAYVVGPGFAVGAGTSVTTGGSTLGALPSVPLLGALPSPGGPAWIGLLVAAPLVIGLAAGMLVLRGRSLTRGRLAVDCLATAAVAGAGMLVLAWLSGGPIGPGRLSVSGPEAWRVAAVLTLQLAVAATLSATLGHFLRHED